jgi:hypothetical protein
VTVFSKKMPPWPQFVITVFSKKIFPPWPRIQERLELFPGLIVQKAVYVTVTVKTNKKVHWYCIKLEELF